MLWAPPGVSSKLRSSPGDVNGGASVLADAYPPEDDEEEEPNVVFGLFGSGCQGDEDPFEEAPTLSAELTADPSTRVLIAWLEKEVQNRLLNIEDKLDRMLEQPARRTTRHTQRSFGPLLPARRLSLLRQNGYLAKPPPPRTASSQQEENVDHLESELLADQPLEYAAKGRRALRQPRGVPQQLLPTHSPSVFMAGFNEDHQSDEGDNVSNGTPRSDDDATVKKKRKDPARHASNEILYDADKRRNMRNASDHPLASGGEIRPLEKQKRLTELIEFQDRVTGRNKYRGKRTEALWSFLEEPESSRAAHHYAHFMPLLIMFSVCLTILQTGNPPIIQGVVPSVVEISLDVIFMIEVMLRWAVSPNCGRFLLSGYNLVDMSAIPTMPMRVAMLVHMNFDMPASQTLIKDETLPVWFRTFFSILLCVVPVIRLFKLLRRFEKFHLLFHAFELAVEALPVLLFTGAILLLVASSSIFFFEERTNIDSFPRAMWLSIVTMTTVGYGDYAPKSTAGTLITSVLVVASALYMSIPIGIVGNAFNRVWEDRDRLLLMQRTRKRLAQWGYTPRDIATFFQLFSTAGDGALTLIDFERMIEEMKLGLSERRVMGLFELLDEDGSGTIEPEEFVAVLFPNTAYTFPDMDWNEDEGERMNSLSRSQCSGGSSAGGNVDLGASADCGDFGKSADCGASGEDWRQWQSDG